jgi:two-component system, OmpR family, KDP operon response regulator KdpE
MKVFVVDDNAGTRRFITGLLTSMTRHEVFGFTTAEDALDEIRRQPPSVLLTDLDLPGLSGESLARLASRLSAPPRIVLMSGDARRLQAARVFASGLLTKPFSIEELLFWFEEPSGDS